MKYKSNKNNQTKTGEKATGVKVFIHETPYSHVSLVVMDMTIHDILLHHHLYSSSLGGASFVHLPTKNDSNNYNLEKL